MIIFRPKSLVAAWKARHEDPNTFLELHIDLKRDGDRW